MDNDVTESKSPAAGPATPPKDEGPEKDVRAHQKIMVRNRSLRYIHKQMLVLVLWSALTTLLAVIGAVMAFQTKLPPQYIPVDEQGLLLPMIPLNKPSLDESGINEFALDALRAVNTFDYINWRNQFPAAEDFFTPKSWENYLAELTSRNTMNAIVERRMIVTPNFMGAPRVVEEGLDGEGVYNWKVEQKVRIDYRAHVIKDGGATDNGNQQYGTIVLTIQRVPTPVSARGVAIKTYMFLPSTPEAAAAVSASP
jgi:intracellular multiplication protein IcmL